MADYEFRLGFSNNQFACYQSPGTSVLYYSDGTGLISLNLGSAGTTQLGRTYVIFGAYEFGQSSLIENDIINGDYSKVIGLLAGRYYHSDTGTDTAMLIYNYNGWKTTQITNTTKSIVMNNNFVSGVSSLSVTADSGINHILYNNVTYDTFPATIPLDPAATTMQVESKSPVLTINDGGNLKSVTYGSATYTKFPATVTATTPEFAVTARGKDSPVITVRTERTQTPVITNT